MTQIILAHAEEDESLAEQIAAALSAAGYQVIYQGSLLVGESLVQEASKALSAGSPVVLCGTVTALGTGWAHLLVNAARAHIGARIYALQMEKRAYLQQLALDGLIAQYWQDPARAVTQLIGALHEHYPPQPSMDSPITDDLEGRYRELSLRTYDIVDLANLPVADRNLVTRELLLRSLYVSLRVSTEDVSDAIGSIEPSRRSRVQQQGSQGGRSLPYAQRWSVGEKLAEAHQLVILGDPGAGKSTLMRWIATAYLLRLNKDPDWQQLPDVSTLPDKDWIPILIRCRDLERPHMIGSPEQILTHHLEKLGITAAETPALKTILLNRISEGRALLLFDGLDEIVKPSLRARFCRNIEQIRIAYPDTPIIATSRIVGYREIGMRIGRGFEHATVLDLTAKDKDEFIRRWCFVTEPSIRRSTTEKELIKDIHSTDRIERLTGNPMLLTTMALVKRKVGKLPSKRADLYREAVDVLLNWRSEVDELLDPYEAMPQLEYIAYMMCHKGLQQLRSDEIISTLTQMRQEFPSVRAARQHTPVHFLQLLERRTGILVETGRVRYKGRMIPVYEFRHLTFQEYLAGMALVEGRFPNRNRSVSLAENVTILAAQVKPEGSVMTPEAAITENWREALRLCVMSCNDDDVDGVLRAIATPRADEDTASTGRPRALLAAACLSDEPNVGEEVASEVIDRFVSVLREEDGSGSAATLADTVLVELSTCLWRSKVARQIITTWQSQSWTTMWLGGSASVVCGREAPMDDKAGLHKWLESRGSELSSSRGIDRICAALAIMDVAFREATAETPNRIPELEVVSKLVPGLMQMMNGSRIEKDAAAWALGWLGNARIDPAWKPTVQQRAIIFSKIRDTATPPHAVGFLIWTLSGDLSRYHRIADAIAARLIPENPQARGDLEMNLENSLVFGYPHLFPKYGDPIILQLANPSATIRRRAVQLLGRIDAPNVLGALLGALEDQDREVQNATALALGGIGDASAVQPLTDLLPNATQDLQHTIVEAVGSIGDASAVQPLTDLLPNATRDLQRIIVRALGSIGDASAVQPLTDLLPNATQDLQHTIVEAVGSIGDASAVQPLTDLLPNATQDLQHTIAEALGKIGDERAIGPLTALVQQHERMSRPSIVAALVNLGADWALQAFHQALRSRSAVNRTAALWAMARTEPDSVDRTLLSRDADGIEPGIDPAVSIRKESIERYVEATDLTADEVCRHYERIQAKYELRLSWLQSPAS